MNKRTALIMTLAVIALTNYAAVLLTDISFPGKQKKRTYSVAGIAVRDNVFAYQKKATKIFTRPYLKRLYDDFIYLEEKNIGNQQDKFITGLKRLLTSYDSVDIYLLAHGNTMVDWLSGMDKKLTKKIRLVYNCGCNNARQYADWASLGVKYYLGHTGEQSLSPIFFYFFIRRRADGRSLNKSIKGANWHTRLLLSCIGFSRSKAGESCASLYTF